MRRLRMSISLSIAPVAPEPQKITTVVVAAADGVVDDPRARPREAAVVCRPVPLVSVCVFA